MSDPEKTIGMVVSMGNSPDAARAALARFAPRRVVFVVSPKTHRDACTVAGETPSIESHNFLIIKDPYSLNGAYRTVRNQLPELLDTLGITRAQAIIDFTGGTKAMSGALLLASAEMGFQRFNYVNVKKSDDGTGTVKIGRASCRERV